MQSTSSDEFRDLQTLVRQRGLLAKRPAYYGRKMLLNLVLLVIALLLIKRFHGPGLELCNAGFLAFVFAQFGFIVHDSGHQQILKAPTCNEAICLVHSNLLLGFSYSWWLNKHSRHHSAPNHIPSDPDVDLIPFAFSRDQVAQKRGLTRLSVKYQHFSFFPLSLLEAFALKAYSVGFLLRNRVRHPLLEVGCLTLHSCWYFGLLYLFLGGPHAILFAIEHHALLGLYLTLIFAPNHQGMPLLQGDTGLNFLREQVITTRNIREHLGIDLCFGGLACQIEHHLFPTMPSSNLRQAQEIVRPYCESHSVPYHETPPWRASAKRR